MRWENVHDLIGRRYASAHGAVPVANYPHFCTISRNGGNEPSAVLGFRLAKEGRLFLEDYLDSPVEEVVSALLACPIERDRIVEIGAHASDRSRATIELWALTARHVSGTADVAVAVLTEPLRDMFNRLGIPIIEICDADPARLNGAGEEWGRYYEMRPKVCAGLIAPALPKLAGFNSQRGHCS